MTEGYLAACANELCSNLIVTTGTKRYCCLSCNNSQRQREYLRRKKGLRLETCRHRDCSNLILTTGKQKFCSKACMYSERNYRHSAEINQSVRQRRLRKRHVGGHHTEAEWEELKRQYKNKCLSCGRSEPAITLTRDHVLPLALGGRDDIGNIQPLCHSCNSRKRTKHVDHRTEEWVANH